LCLRSQVSGWRKMMLTSMSGFSRFVSWISSVVILELFPLPGGPVVAPNQALRVVIW
jgi:hypothetical protein